MERKVRGYLIDSDILIDYLRGLKAAQIFLLRESPKRPLWISVINVIEIYSGKETKKLKKRKLIDTFLDSFEITQLDMDMAKRAGEIRRDHQKPFADAIMAAIALNYNLILITKNKKHFKGIKNLKVISPY